MIKHLIVVVAVLVASCLAASAQGVPNGYCTLTPTVSTALSSCPVQTTYAPAGGVPPGTTSLVACAYTQGVVYRPDGVAATGTPGSGGILISPTSCIWIVSRPDLLRFIQQASGAVLGVAFWK